MESRVGGNDASGGVNEQNAVATSIANSQQTIALENDALQGGAGSCDRCHNIADTIRGDLEHLIAGRYKKSPEGSSAIPPALIIFVRLVVIKHQHS